VQPHRSVFGKYRQLSIEAIKRIIPPFSLSFDRPFQIKKETGISAYIHFPVSKNTLSVYEAFFPRFTVSAPAVSEPSKRARIIPVAAAAPVFGM
jgi:hypothetical protein